MSIEQNKDVVRRYVDAVNRGNLDALDDLVSPDFVDHNALPGQQPGIPGLKAAYAMFLAAFPDVVFDLQDVIGEGDKVVGRGVMIGTHRGGFFGVAATGRRAQWTGTRTFTVRDGKVTEGWIDLDLYGLMQQLTAQTPAQS